MIWAYIKLLLRGQLGLERHLIKACLQAGTPGCGTKPGIESMSVFNVCWHLTDWNETVMCFDSGNLGSNPVRRFTLFHLQTVAKRWYERRRQLQNFHFRSFPVQYSPTAHAESHWDKSCLKDLKYSPTFYELGDVSHSEQQDIISTGTPSIL